MASKPTRWPCSVVLSHIFNYPKHSLFLLRRAKDEQGWIMDGFPSTVAQAKLLEKALSGYDANAKPSKNKSRQSRLAVDPNPPKDPPPPVSGIDVVILLDVQDQTAMKRAAGRSCKLLYQKYCHGLWRGCDLRIKLPKPYYMNNYITFYLYWKNNFQTQLFFTFVGFHVFHKKQLQL